MRAITRIAGTLLAVAATRSGFAGDEAKAAAAEFRMQRTAPVDEIRAAVEERAAFDDVTVEFPPDENTIVLRRPGLPFRERDELVSQLRVLDEALAVRAHLRELTDDGLRAAFDSVCTVPSSKSNGPKERDPVLLEIARRGGAVWRDRFRAKLVEMDAWQAAADGDDRVDCWGEPRDFEVLTALRRIEGKPDSIRIEVTAPDACTHPDFPTVQFRVVNRDERPVMWTSGGNYRTGRKERYSVEVRDAKGRIQPGFEWPFGLMSGGVMSRGRLGPGEARETSSLPLSRYVAPLDPGEYRVRILYSDWKCIADPDREFGVVTAASEPFAVRVLPRTIETTHDEQARLAALCETLPSSEFNPDDEPSVPSPDDQVPPRSCMGRLLAAGWTAFPPLVRIAGRAGVDPMRRARALSILYGIVGRLRPTPVHYGAFRVYPEDRSRIDVAWRSTSAASGVRPIVDPAEQDELARAWAKMAKAVQVRETK